MNRLVIIGNGFDLAHGLPTSYKHFIDDFWKNFKDKCQSEEYQKLVKTHDLYNGYYNGSNQIENFNDLKLSLKNYSQENGHFYESNTVVCRNNQNTIFAFKSEFFRLINRKNSENWVDIENQYYNQLKLIAKYRSLNSNEKKEKVALLNKEFEQVKSSFEGYLHEKVVEKYDLDFVKDKNIDWRNIYNVLKPISLLSNEDNILKEFIKVEDVNEIKQHFDKEQKEKLVNNLYFLNFNYTPIVSIYSEIFQKNDRIESEVNFIHGELKNVSNNKVNFGFGDEMDEDYKLIENIDDNEYLKNFKSFQYLQNSNYNDLLRYINSEKFQVLIMGHSCGLSDRTLLNTIFEHNNCRSIKVFYHETKDENGKVIRDNYTEIVQNISRHFNKKALMREKIVNKTLCQPLPQIQLPIK